MSHKIIGAVLGLAGVGLWFMPFRETLGFSFQAGSQMGEIAYVLLLGSFAYALFSWLGHQLGCLISGAVASGMSIYFVLELGKSSSWTLIALTAVSIVSLGFALKGKFTSRKR